MACAISSGVSRSKQHPVHPGRSALASTARAALPPPPCSPAGSGMVYVGTTGEASGEAKEEAAGQERRLPREAGGASEAGGLGDLLPPALLL